jgi:hypothetical protein
MTHLEKLTLYLRNRKASLFVGGTSPFIDGTHLHNEILIYMPQLHAFNFYISTEVYIKSSIHRMSNNDIEQTFTNIRYGETTCIIDYFGACGTTCHVYSLPFTFTRLGNITTHFPFIVFDTVTHLCAYNLIPFNHEFFMRINQAFPLLKCFSIKNDRIQDKNCDDNPSYSVIEFSHLISLDVIRANVNYLEQFLLETTTHLPRLTHLKVKYDDLKTVTMNFTRNATRRNCSKVNRLIVKESRIFPKDIYQYFPSL